MGLAMVTWVQVMELVRTMYEARQRTGRIDEAHANQLVSLLIAFQEQLDEGPAPVSERVPKRSV
jgi:hypothetical protein